MTAPDEATTHIALFLVVVAILSVILGMGSAAGPDPDVADGDRLLVGVLFIVVSSVGVTMAVRPNWRARVLGKRVTDETDGDDRSHRLRGPPRRGHHPECEAFAGHVLVVGDRPRCAGCTGLALGAVIASGLMALFVLTPSVMPGDISLVAVMVSVTFVGGVYLETILDHGRGGIHFALNALLVVAFYLIVASSLVLTGEVIIAIYALGASILFLEVRVRLGHINHASTCARCPEACKAYL